MHDIRMQKNRFEPGRELASNVAKLESRIVMNSTFKFPAGFVGMTPGQKGNLILTSRAYGQAQNSVNKAFSNFAGSLAKLRNRYGVDYLQEAKVQEAIGLAPGATVGEIPANSLLGRLNASLRAAEAKFPFGRGVAEVAPGETLGVGLSVESANSALTWGNPTNAALAALPEFAGIDPMYANGGIAAFMQTGLAEIAAGTFGYNERQLIEGLRQSALKFNQVDGLGTIGLMPNYIATYGSIGGPGYFSTKNS